MLRGSQQLCLPPTPRPQHSVGAIVSTTAPPGRAPPTPLDEARALAPYGLIPLLARLQTPQPLSPSPSLSPLSQPTSSLAPWATQPPALDVHDVASIELIELGISTEVLRHARANKTAPLAAQLLKTWLHAAPQKGLAYTWICESLSAAVLADELPKLARALTRLARLPLFHKGDGCGFFCEEEYFALTGSPSSSAKDALWFRAQQLQQLVGSAQSFNVLWALLLEWEQLTRLGLGAEDVMHLGTQADGAWALVTLAQACDLLSLCGFDLVQMRSLLWAHEPALKIALACRCSDVFVRREASVTRFVELCHERDVCVSELEHRFVEQRGKHIFLRYDARHMTLCAAPIKHCA